MVAVTVGKVGEVLRGFRFPLAKNKERKRLKVETSHRDRWGVRSGSKGRESVYIVCEKEWRAGGGEEEGERERERGREKGRGIDTYPYTDL